MENEDSYQDCPDSPYTCPYGVRSAYRQALCGFCQQSHTYHCKHKESDYPTPPSKTFNGFCPSEAVSKADLAEAGYN